MPLEKLSTSKASDVHMYLSNEQGPNFFINLDKLNLTKSNPVYDVSGKCDFEPYKYVQVHCQQYKHRFKSADLTK